METGLQVLFPSSTFDPFKYSSLFTNALVFNSQEEETVKLDSDDFSLAAPRDVCFLLRSLIHFRSCAPVRTQV